MPPAGSAPFRPLPDDFLIAPFAVSPTTDGISSELHPGAARAADSTGPRGELKLLWIDDECTREDPLAQLLELEGWSVDLARTGAEGLGMAERSTYDAIVVDLRLPDMFGLTVVRRLVAKPGTPPILVVTGYFIEPETEPQALRAGAVAFLRKPLFGPEDLLPTLRAAIARSFHASPLAVPRSPSSTESFDDIVAVSPAMRTVIEWVTHVAHTDATILLTGETGTGKEVIARAIHRASGRKKYPFVPVNCGAIPEALIESELFGHRKGAFTGATSDKTGLAPAAHRGTLFLDECADLPLPIQGHLLRFLGLGEVRRLGDTRTIHVDARVIAATNRPLERYVRDGRFREDLFYRLCVLHCHIPPLRQRPDDLDALVRCWLPSLAQRNNSRVVGMTPEALAILREHTWPGNVRELHNVLERAICLSSGNRMTADDVANALSILPMAACADHCAGARLDQMLTVLVETQWNRTKAAERLGINRTTLWRRLRRQRVERQDKS
jgi:DNA-binding NtrC family response regulator